jgi:hypothetical protein
MTDDLEKELKKIIKVPDVTVDDLMAASGRGLRYNSDKLRYDLIPPLANKEYAKVWTQALDKYPEGNWEKGMPWSEVIASAMRHLEAIRLGKDIDEESGLLHAAHLMCNAAMLAEFHYTHPEFDDRKKY